MPTRLQLARQDILTYFENTPRKIYKQSTLAATLTENRDKWRLATRTSVNDFTDYLVNRTKLRKITLKGPHQTITLYVWGEASPYEIAQAIRPSSYLSHGTAVFLHGLTQQMPRVIYANKEQREKPVQRQTLTQPALTQAFARPQRQSNLIFSHRDWRIILLSGKYSEEAEVGLMPGPNGEELRVTKLERTLIDIVVRPSYAGGVFQVLEAFRSAKDRVSTNVLLATLKKLDFLYPYQQAIGFCMERAGFESDRYEHLLRIRTDLNFYMAHGMKEVDYDSKWRLYFPQGL